jgi:hypothetical protein
MPLLGENAIRFKASESDRMDVASPIAARMRKAADLTAQATSFDDFERLDPEISAGDTLINFGQQADFGLWRDLAVLPDRVIDLDTDLARAISEREVVLSLMGDNVPGDSNVTTEPRCTDLVHCDCAPCCTWAGELGIRGRGKQVDKQENNRLRFHGVLLDPGLRRMFAESIQHWTLVHSGTSLATAIAYTRIARIILYATLSGGPLPTDAALLPLTPPAPKRPTKQKWLYGNRPVKPRFVVAWSSTYGRQPHFA